MEQMVRQNNELISRLHAAQAANEKTKSKPKKKEPVITILKEITIKKKAKPKTKRNIQEVNEPDNYVIHSDSEKEVKEATETKTKEQGNTSKESKNNKDNAK